MRVSRKRPCAQCPFLRTSARGYLGSDDAEHFYRQAISGEGDMPCHMAIDYTDPGWRESQLPDAARCAGQLIYFRNHMRVPRRLELAEAVEQVAGSPHVFAWPEEWMRHHMPGKSDEKILAAVRRSFMPPLPEGEGD